MNFRRQVSRALDDEHRASLTACCERALAEFGSEEGGPGSVHLPIDHPPLGFVREMLDAVDLNLRTLKAGGVAM